jgi:hypothetical protein
VVVVINSSSIYTGDVARLVGAAQKFKTAFLGEYRGNKFYFS